MIVTLEWYLRFRVEVKIGSRENSAGAAAARAAERVYARLYVIGYEPTHRTMKWMGQFNYSFA